MNIDYGCPRFPGDMNPFFADAVADGATTRMMQTAEKFFISEPALILG